MRVAVDSNIFFFAITHGREHLKKRDIKPGDIKNFLQHVSGHPDIELCIPVSVLAEIVAICLKGEHESKKHTIEELFDLIEFWRGLEISFLHPNKAVAIACHALYMDKAFMDSRLKPSDLVHLGYALAYNLDYLITTDKTLRDYRVPDEFKLQITHPKDANDIF